MCSTCSPLIFTLPVQLLYSLKPFDYNLLGRGTGGNTVQPVEDAAGLSNKRISLGQKSVTPVTDGDSKRHLGTNGANAVVLGHRSSLGAFRVWLYNLGLGSRV